MKNVSIVLNKKGVSHDIPFEEYLNMVANGDTTNVYEYRRTMVDDPVRAQKMKVGLPACTVAGTFSKIRNNNTLNVYSGIVCIDIDEEVSDTIIESMKKSRYILAIHRTVSNKGVAVYFDVATGPELHGEAYDQCADMIELRYRLKVDRVCKDLARLRYISHDKNLYRSTQWEVFQVLDPETYHRIQDQVRYSHQKVAHQEGSRNAFIYQLGCNCARLGIDDTILAEYCISRYEESGFDGTEIKTAINSAYKSVGESDAPASFIEDGVEIVSLQSCSPVTKVHTPYLEDFVYDNLPPFFDGFNEVITEPRQRDLLTLSLITMLSALFPDTHGIHDGSVVNANLYLLITAPAGSGKGKMKMIPKIMEKVDNHIKDECIRNKKRYKMQCSACNNDPACVDEVPTIKCKEGALAAANISSTALINILSEGDVNLIADSEADILNATAKQEWASLLDPILRQSYHHELVTIGRVDGGIRTVKHPRLSILLSGTPKQALGLAKSVESGLTSRFMYYAFNQPKKVESQFKASSQAIPELETKKSDELLSLYQYGRKHPFKFEFTDEQHKTHLQCLERWAGNASNDDPLFGTAVRMGLICFRIGMILTIVKRYRENNTEQTYRCNDLDFNLAISICDTLFEHAKYFHGILSNTKPDKYQVLLNALPKEFPRQAFTPIAMSILNLEERQTDNILVYLQSKMWIKKDKYGKYSKC
jgi:hypothetical protein